MTVNVLLKILGEWEGDIKRKMYVKRYRRKKGARERVEMDLWWKTF